MCTCDVSVCLYVRRSVGSERQSDVPWSDSRWYHWPVLDVPTPGRDRRLSYSQSVCVCQYVCTYVRRSVGSEWQSDVPWSDSRWYRYVSRQPQETRLSMVSLSVCLSVCLSVSCVIGNVVIQSAVTVYFPRVKCQKRNSD